MLRGTESFERAIQGGYEAVVRCEAWLAGRRIAANLPLVDGSVTVDSGEFVRRTASLTFSGITPEGDDTHRILSQPGCEVRVWKGVRTGGRSELLPVHWGLAERVVRSRSASMVTVTSPDRAMRISLDRFPTPRASAPGVTFAEQLSILVKESLGVATRIVDESGEPTAVPPVTWERDRNDAITFLATAIGCETFWRPDGSWVLRRVRTILGIADFRVAAGATLVDSSQDTDWGKVRNRYMVASERADGTSLSALSEDLDPLSPTRVSGPLGPRLAFYDSPLLTSEAQCRAAGHALVAKMSGYRAAVSFEARAHPGLEAGDRVDIVDGSTTRAVLDSFTLPLFGDTVTGEARTFVLPQGDS